MIVEDDETEEIAEAKGCELDREKGEKNLRGRAASLPRTLTCWEQMGTTEDLKKQASI